VNYKLYKRPSNAEGATWATPVANGTSGSATTNGGFLSFFAGNNVTSFSQFVLSNEGLLPVELVDFQCFVVKKSVQLTWQTASEINTDGFGIERSTDGGLTYERIGFVKARGTATKRTDYVFADVNPVVGVNYYRLKIEDLGGKSEFSPIRSAILRGPDLDKFSIYPNPTNRVVTVDFETARKGLVRIELVDVVGKVLLTSQAASEIGGNQYPINVAKIAEGTYFLKMTDGQTVSVQRLVVVK
jgi:trimeric autotransporter adhesin